MTLFPRLPDPTPLLIIRAIEEFDRDDRYGPADQILTRIFGDFPSNRHFEHVLLKVVLLNSLYSTNIYATTDMSRHILSLGVDDRLASGAPDLVEAVSTITVKGIKRRHYSFSTKFCSWHRPELYPIFDSLVAGVLRQYRDRDRFASFAQADLRDYAKYRSAIVSFRSHYGLTEFSFKEVTSKGV
jgi:hypothetical protein